MNIPSRSGLMKGVIHAMPSCTASDKGNVKINGRTLEMNVNDDNLSCARRKSRVYKEKVPSIERP
jgi:hypothetical protein